MNNNKKINEINSKIDHNKIKRKSIQFLCEKL